MAKRAHKPVLPEAVHEETHKELSSLFSNVSHIVIAVAFIVVALGSGYVLYNKKEVHAETALLKKETVTQTVKVTGQVQAAKDATLAFQTSGTVSYIATKVGDTVEAGKVLATLSSLDEQANVLQAEASLENAQANLASLKEGSRPEEIAIEEQAVKNADSSLKAVYDTLPDSIRNVDAVTSDSIKNKLAPLFIYAGDQYTLSFSSCDQKLQSQIESQRSMLELTLQSFQKRSTLITTISTKDEINDAFAASYDATVATNNLVSMLSSLLLAPCAAQNTSLDSYRASLAVARTNMTNLFSDISAKRSALTSAQNALDQARRNLALTNAGTDKTKIRAQEALVAQAQANLASAKARLSKTIITAPFDGVVTDVSLNEGDTATALKPAISMISKNAFEVDANIPEIDIAKLHVGDAVNITLDAYGDASTFPATITRIDPAATFEGNVPKYKIIATFTHDDDRIKSGMTANLTIWANNATSTLALPVRFVHVTDSSHGEVIVEEDGQTKTVPVTLGIRGENGLIQIVDGLREGETVVAIQPGVRQAQKVTQ